MTKEQAIDILVQVANMAQKSGVLSMQDSATTLQAIIILTKKDDTKNGVGVCSVEQETESDEQKKPDEKTSGETS